VTIYEISVYCIKRLGETKTFFCLFDGKKVVKGMCTTTGLEKSWIAAGIRCKTLSQTTCNIQGLLIIWCKVSRVSKNQNWQVKGGYWWISVLTVRQSLAYNVKYKARNAAEIWNVVGGPHVLKTCIINFLLELWVVKVIASCRLLSHVASFTEAWFKWSV